MKTIIALFAADVVLIWYTVSRLHEYYSSKDIVGNWRGVSGWVLVCIFLSYYLAKKTKTVLSEKKRRGDSQKKQEAQPNDE